MKTVLKLLLGLVAILLVTLAGVYVWATLASNRILSQTFEAHAVDFPIPYPLKGEEVARLGVTVEEGRRLALERAIERGRHLVEARYACVECHGNDLSGGVMVDAFPIGQILGPNITVGRGSRTAEYVSADWDRIVRHGILPDGTPSAMPSEDFQLMSDQELSDVVAFVGSRPAVDNTVPTPQLGPLGKILIATGQRPLAVDLVESHVEPHPELPPSTAVSVEFGRYLAGTCTGCHRADLSGGRIAAGDPSWVPARNLTPDPEALGDWSFADFERATREGLRPDGSELQLPMTLVIPYAQSMLDVELEALWIYLQLLPPIPSVD